MYKVLGLIPDTKNKKKENSRSTVGVVLERQRGVQRRNQKRLLSGEGRGDKVGGSKGESGRGGVSGESEMTFVLST